jgi:4-amino-4-deoxy-L-arabinose transferase-like glycosyltransferase
MVSEYLSRPSRIWSLVLAYGTPAVLDLALQPDVSFLQNPPRVLSQNHTNVSPFPPSLAWSWLPGMVVCSLVWLVAGGRAASYTGQKTSKGRAAFLLYFCLLPLCLGQFMAYHKGSKSICGSRCQWLTPVILTTQEDGGSKPAPGQ